MRILLNRAVCVFCFFMFSGVAIAEVNGYLCIPEKSTGFSYRNHEWTATNFNVKDSKYVLTAKDGKWLWKKMGEPDQEKYPQFCIEKNNGYMGCEFSYRKVSFNNQTLRFQIYTEGSYVIHNEMKKELEKNGENNDSYLEIGTCTNL